MSRQGRTIEVGGTTSLSLEEHVYRQLREMILRGELKPGLKLVQEELAQQLGVSRTPLRSAIAGLGRDGLVSLTPRGEATVIEFGLRRIADLFEIRAVLEGLTCRLVAPTIERRSTMYLRSIIMAAAPAEGSDDWSAYRAADVDFHTHLTSLLGDGFLARQLEPLQGIMNLSLAQGLLRPPQETLSEHLKIVDALEAHDPDAAEQAMLTHVRNSVSVINRKANEESSGRVSPPGFERINIKGRER